LNTDAQPSVAEPNVGSPRTFLVTGGAGFIGSHLTDALLDRGDRVVILDDLSTGRLSNLAHLEEHPHLQVIPGSVRDEMIVDELVHECDAVVHLAAAVGVKLIVDEPLRSFTTNIRGSEVVIGAAHRYRRPILITSTSEIYGKNGSEALHEESDRILGTTSTTRWSYSTAKAVDEILALNYHRERGLPATIVRLFNTVGPRQSAAYGMVIPNLVRQAVRNEPLTVHGDGEQSRCFCHVSDVVDALTRLLDRPGVGEIFNVGANQEITIRQLAERIIARAGSTSEIRLVPYEDVFDKNFEDMRRRVPAIGKIQRATDWTPRRTLDDIIDEVVAEARTELVASESESEVIDLSEPLTAPMRT